MVVVITRAFPHRRPAQVLAFCLGMVLAIAAAVELDAVIALLVLRSWS